MNDIFGGLSQLVNAGTQAYGTVANAGGSVATPSTVAAAPAATPVNTKWLWIGVGGLVAVLGLILLLKRK